ncbi:DUF222 domain-containing protein [Actinoplanes sp. NEAU-A12]|uniref:DUF222 domain-containing protein n=1 Tax=Actinoplanes sandaracinus TaxID=3045177 RepID=A0ABT6WBR6_9ACTN|nr:HNH endonuclease signature motif containing protein [Actinoplanes sandaracinus]MDI6097163.1 DUF222 domain-containing protein [Actinoplanes sandaracinus]
MRMTPLSQAELLDFLDDVHAAQQTLHAAVLHAVREVERRGIPAGQRAPSLRAWLRGRLRISTKAALRLAEQATLVDRDPSLDAAVIAGTVNAEQLATIAAALAVLPASVGPQVRDQAGEVLAGWAPSLGPAALRIAGRRILDHVAPELAEAEEERWLRGSERQAHEQRTLTLSPIGDGRVRVRGILDSEAAAIVTAALDPLCKPDAAATEIAGTGETRTPGQRRADALTEVCRIALTGGRLPDNGGDRPQIAITVSYDALRNQLRAGHLDNGEPVSAETVRRLACDARILPIVLGGKGQILDTGRTRRLATGSIRLALNARDGGCVFPGCDRPPRWCDAHHIISWTLGGPTDLANLALLCGFHHRVIHDDTGWQIRLADDGHPEFLPPAWLDPDRQPRRNEYHHRPRPHLRT